MEDIKEMSRDELLEEVKEALIDQKKWDKWNLIIHTIVLITVLWMCYLCLKVLVDVEKKEIDDGSENKNIVVGFISNKARVDKVYEKN